MKQIIASRGIGKSTQLLRMALDEKANLAVCFRSQLRYYVDIAKSLGVDESEIKVAPDYLKIRDTVVAPIDKFTERGLPLLAQNPLYIDDLEWCVGRLIHARKIAGYSISLESNLPELE